MLQKALVPVDFTGGLDTKSNPLLVQPGKLLAAENLCVRGGTLEKRPGSVALPDAGLDGSALTQAEALATFRDELLRWTSTDLNTYAGGSSAWASRGATLPLSLRREAVVQNGHNLANFDVASLGTLRVYAWEDCGTSILTPPTVCVRVVDEVTGAVHQHDVSVASASGPRLVALSGAVVLLYVSGTTLWAQRLTAASPTAFSAAFSVATGLTASAFDAVEVGGQAFVAYAKSAAAGLGLALVSAAGVVTSNPGIATGTAPGLISLGTDAADNVFIFYRDGTSLGLYVRTAALAPILGPIFLATVDDSLTRVAATTGGADVRYFTEHQSAATSGTGVPDPAGTTFLQVGRVTSTGVDQSLDAYLQRAKLAGHPFSLAGRTLLPLAYTGHAGRLTTQPTLLVVDTGSGEVVARALEGVSTLGGGYGFGGAAFRPTRLARVTASGNEVLVPAAVRGRFTPQAYLLWGSGGPGYVATDATVEGLCALRLEAVSANALPRIETEGALCVGGALPRFYDGVTAPEAGFHHPPEAPVATNAGTHTTLPAGPYQYRVLYEWTDAQGARHQSIPSPAETLALPAGGSVTVTAVPLQLTERGATRSSVKVVLYRTESAGTIFYRCAEADGTGASPLTFLDSLPDGSLLAREILYTQGGVLESLPPPAHRLACIHGKRLVVAGLEDVHEFRYSQELVKGEGIAFNESLSGRIPESGGELTALASMDGKLILFSERQTFAVAGDGPNAAGQQNTFTEPQLVASDVGCTDWRSVVVTPLGVLFKSERGFYLLTRALQAQPIGAEVSAHDADTITSAVLLPDEEEVRFTTAEGRTLVYHYGYGTWLVWTGHGGADALVWGGRYTRAVGGRVLQESPGTWTDAGAAYGILAQTAWLKVAGIQGAQRVWRALLVGRMASDATLSMTALYDYESAGVSAIPNTAVTQAAHPGGVFQLRHHLARQKCEAVSFVIQASSSGEGFALTNLTLEVGVKKGARKLPASRTA